jgi:predicted glycosyltransferase
MTIGAIRSPVEGGGSARESLLLYCQHSLGMGHLVRSFALARELAKRYDVAFVNGGRLPPGVVPPSGLRIVQLPPLGMDEDGALVSLDGSLTVEESFGRRSDILLSTLERERPRVLVIELFPFGRKKFARELTPLLDAARRASPAPLVLCSLRDILVGARDDQQAFDDRAAAQLERWFDGVLVHSDPRFARLEESFRPARMPRVPIHYTGFVTGNARDGGFGTRERRVLVSAGGGIVGGRLLRAALDAQRELWPASGIPMTIVAGPFLPDAEWRDLERRARGAQGLTLLRSVPDLGAAMRSVTTSVSQCGYNTAMDFLSAGVKPLVVPFTRTQENEQLNRALRLEKLGLVRLLREETLDAETLAHALCELADFTPDRAAFDFDGAAESARLIARLLAPDAAPMAMEATR